MNNNVQRSALVSFFAGLIALLMAPANADAAPAAPRPAVTSICDTGYRGMPEYDRKCLRTGTFKDGAMMWLSTPEGRKGRESRDMNDRRSICKYAYTLGGIRPAVREIFNDTAYDHYRNYGTVVTWAALTAQIDCRSMGYRV